MPIEQPTTPADVPPIVQTAAQVRVRGAGSKPALSTWDETVTVVDCSRLSGILAYKPEEYVFSAYAGTPAAEAAAALAQHGQHLPFDPLLIAQGATLGGTVAANLSGSGRYRYGGVRDFILGVRFVDGAGRLARAGGQVVKNAAGFDLPKFFVGSLGRYGILVEVAFKVFPRPPAYTTLLASYGDLGHALSAALRLGATPFDMEGLDIEGVGSEEGGVAARLAIRLGGLSEALPARLARLATYLSAHTPVVAMQRLTQREAEEGYWAAVNGCHWVPAGQTLVKVPLAAGQVLAFDRRLGTNRRRYSAGGHIAWVAAPDALSLQPVLEEMQLVGLPLTGATGEIVGRRSGLALAQRVKQALDPAGKFGPV